MAEVPPVILKPPGLKKRKNENKIGLGGGKKQIMLTDLNSVTKPSSSVVQNVVKSNQSNGEVRKTYHIGGTKYMIFHGFNDVIESVYFKDWDGKKVNSSLKLNISKFVMILHTSDAISKSLDKICNGDKDISEKEHIGELFYLTCSSPYKNVQIRKWRKNKDDELFPTREGISLKSKEWRELLKYSNQIYSERLELFQTVPCLLDPTLTGHDSLLCQECSVLCQDAKGVVDVIIR